jgi:uncharacterized protein (UPF0264 family)
VSVRLLVSVRDAPEALAAAAAGADLVDLKEPLNGALGALPPERIAQIVAVLRARHPGVRISATIGDLAADLGDRIVARVRRVAACGVDDIKVGVWPAAPVLGIALLDALAACRESVVPVLVADHGIAPEWVQHALALQAFPALMVDTAEKGRGSVLQRLPGSMLAGFVSAVRSRGCLAGVAGSLRLEDGPALRELAPDFAGFRGAVTRGDRTGALDPARVRLLRRQLATE